MALDPKVLYWTGAWINMLAIVVLALWGVRKVRRREIAAHRRRMLGAAALVVVFLISYALKLLFLGREQLDTWAPTYRGILRFHEACIAVMIVAGGSTLYLAYRLRLAIAPDGSQSSDDPSAIPNRLALHRRAGRTAVAAAALGLFSAAVVLLGMYRRAGLL